MPDHSLIELWKSKLVRKASRMVVIDSLKRCGITSWFGRVTHGNPNETWPTWENTLLWPLLQLNLSELPFRPTELHDIELVRVFIHPEFHEFNCEKGEGWELRVSKSVSGLAPIDANHQSDVLPKPISWELIEEDYPSFEDIPSDFPEELRDLILNREIDSPLINAIGTKVGGWPSLVQAEISWAPWNQHPINPRYLFQIDSFYDANWQWGDFGTAYFGRGQGGFEGKWAMEWQCC